MLFFFTLYYKICLQKGGDCMLELYTNIKKERLAHGWTQTELSTKMGYSDKSMIAKIENGKVDLSQSKIVAFSKVFGCTPGALMGWTDEIEVSDPNEEYVMRAKAYYNKYLSATAKTRKIVDQLLDED